MIVCREGGFADLMMMMMMVLMSPWCVYTWLYVKSSMVVYRSSIVFEIILFDLKEKQTAAWEEWCGVLGIFVGGISSPSVSCLLNSSIACTWCSSCPYLVEWCCRSIVYVGVNMIHPIPRHHYPYMIPPRSTPLSDMGQFYSKTETVGL